MTTLFRTALTTRNYCFRLIQLFLRYHTISVLVSHGNDPWLPWPDHGPQPPIFLLAGTVSGPPHPIPPCHTNYSVSGLGTRKKTKIKFYIRIYPLCSYWNCPLGDAMVCLHQFFWSTPSTNPSRWPPGLPHT